jgi:peptide/nickel transport system permease protein
MFRSIIRNKKLFVGLIMVLTFVSIGIFAKQIMPYDYDETYVGGITESPSKQFWFGTDVLGRDVFSRVIYGTRVSLVASASITMMSLIIGVPIGLISGYYGGFIDNILQRIVDIFFSFPWILMGLMVAAIRGPGLASVIIALTITFFPQVIRITRSAVVSVKEQDFVKAAKLTGESDFFIISKYVFPNSLAPLIVQTTIIMSFSILGEAALSYLGWGVRQPLSSWGMMLQQAASYLWTAEHLVLYPGLFIIFAVLSFNFTGDGLRDILDPRYKRIYAR